MATCRVRREPGRAVNDSGAYQLIAFGSALVGVGILNLLANKYERERRLQGLIQQSPEQVEQLRERIIAEENADAGTDSLD